ncbi:MAG: hypothetical protein ACFB5Z_19245 [Elainellaceae cyanobacterium]
MTQLTIELPEQVAKDLEAYLQENPQETLAGLIYEALQIRLTPKDPSQLLTLAGIIPNAPRGASEHAEDFED